MVEENFPLENQGYNAGITNNVKKVAVINPPTMTLASGFWISEPTPMESNMGIKPKAEVIEVIKTGRNRD